MEGCWRIRALDALARTPPGVVWIASTLMVAAVATLDWYCPAEIAASHVYLLPIAFAAWARGQSGAVAIGILATAAWLAVDLGTHFDEMVTAFEVANVAVLLAAFALFGQMIASLRNHLDRARQLADTDPLTGIHNRRAFWSAAGREVARCRRDATPFALAYIDLDGFKAVNDRHGHNAGDEVLRCVAHTMQDALRELDLVARLGGDEFGILLPGTDAPGAEAAITRLRTGLAALELPVATSVGFSVGCLVVASDPPDVDSLVAAADRLMYELKTGREVRWLRNAPVAGEPPGGRSPTQQADETLSGQPDPDRPAFTLPTPESAMDRSRPAVAPGSAQRGGRQVDPLVSSRPGRSRETA